MTTTTMKKPRIQVEGLTIDSEYSKDLDDAFWVVRAGDGYVVDVSIADVAAFVKPGKPLDQAAREKKETKYLRGYNKPMLPRAIAEVHCSLLPGQPRKVLTTRMHLDASFQVVSVEVFKAMVTSAAKLSHHDCDLAVMSPDHPFHDQLVLCQAVATAFYERRRALGACALYDVKSRLYADEDGVIQKYDGDFFHAQMIVQEFMIAANEQQAAFAARADVPFLYRNHETTSASPGRGQVMAQINQALLNPDQLGALASRMTMWMKKAEYGTAALGHFGLNLPGYTHATSPIRRYVDLVNQRQLKAAIQGRPAPYTRDELDALAAEVNQWRRDRQEAVNTTMRDKEVSRRRRQLAVASLPHLPADQFAKLLRLTVKDGADTLDMVTEVVRRAGVGTLTPFDVYYVVFEAKHESWATAQAACCQMLQTRPHHAVSVLEIAKTRKGIAYQVDAVAGPNNTPFYARARLQLPDRSVRAGVAVSDSKRVAVAQAAVMAVDAYRADTLEDDDGQPLVALATAAPIPAASAPEKNWVGLVQEYCQGRRMALPVYEFDATGPSHAPTVTCRAQVRVGGRLLTATATAASKKDAKAAAARELQGQLP